MQLTTKQSTITSAAAGIVVYYIEWIELIDLDCCHNWPDFTIARMYVVPLLLAGVLGFYCYEKPMRCWLLFMLPSWVARMILLWKFGGGNLWPLLFMVDTAHLLLTGLIMGGVAAFRRRSKSGARLA
jgi:hypothetical protein